MGSMAVLPLTVFLSAPFGQFKTCVIKIRLSQGSFCRSQLLYQGFLKKASNFFLFYVVLTARPILLFPFVPSNQKRRQNQLRRLCFPLLGALTRMVSSPITSIFSVNDNRRQRSVLRVQLHISDKPQTNPLSIYNVLIFKIVDAAEHSFPHLSVIYYTLCKFWKDNT